MCYVCYAYIVPNEGTKSYSFDMSEKMNIHNYVHILMHKCMLCICIGQTTRNSFILHVWCVHKCACMDNVYVCMWKKCIFHPIFVAFSIFLFFWMRFPFWTLYPFPPALALDPSSLPLLDTHSSANCQHGPRSSNKNKFNPITTTITCNVSLLDEG